MGPRQALPGRCAAGVRRTGHGAIYCAEDVGGSGLWRIDAVRIFEQLAVADPVIARSSRSTTCAPGWSTPTERRTAQGVGAEAGLDGLDRQLLPHRTGRRLRTQRPCAPGPFATATTTVPRRRQAVHLRRRHFGRLRGDGNAPGRRARAESRRSSSKRARRFEFRAPTRRRWLERPAHRAGDPRGCPVPADAMLGGPEAEGSGFGIAMNGLNGGRLNIAACSWRRAGGL